MIAEENPMGETGRWTGEWRDYVQDIIARCTEALQDDPHNEFLRASRQAWRAHEREATRAHARCGGRYEDFSEEEYEDDESIAAGNPIGDFD